MAMTLYEPAFSVLTKRYPRHFARGITALTLVAGFASTLSFPAVLWLLSALDWRGALAVIGVVLLARSSRRCTPGRCAGPAFGEERQIRRPTALGRGMPTPTTRRSRPPCAMRRFWLLAAAFALYAFAAAALWAT